MHSLQLKCSQQGVTVGDNGTPRHIVHLICSTMPFSTNLSALTEVSSGTETSLWSSTLSSTVFVWVKLELAEFDGVAFGPD